MTTVGRAIYNTHNMVMRKSGNLRIKGFTILELMIVTIIIAILAALGMQQYGAVIERSRGSEARSILGGLRKRCAEWYTAEQNASNCNDSRMGISAVSSSDGIPGICMPSHYFKYHIETTKDAAAFIATRCEEGANGRNPGITIGANRNITLNTDYAQGGIDSWVDPFGY